MNNDQDVYITQFNFERIVPEELPCTEKNNKEQLIAYVRIKTIFNSREINQFVRLWTALENPEILIQYYQNMYDKRKPEAYSSYHFYKNCAELHKCYLDYTIRDIDKSKRLTVSQRVRRAFSKLTYGCERPARLDFEDKRVYEHGKMVLKEFEGLAEETRAIPEDLAREYWLIQKEYDGVLGHLFDVKPNSGDTIFRNRSFANIEAEIDSVLAKGEKYRSSSDDIRREVGAITFADIWKLKKQENKSNSEAYWLNEIKEPLSNLIKTYYWVKFNPELTIKRSFLESLGFKLCMRCEGKSGNHG